MGKIVYIVYGKDSICGNECFFLVNSLPSEWNGDWPVLHLGMIIDYIKCDRAYSIFEHGNTQPFNAYTWCCVNMVPGGVAVFEKHGIRLDLVFNFTVNLHITDKPEPKFDDEYVEDSVDDPEDESELRNSADHSDCVYAGDIPPSDFMVPAEDEPKGDSIVDEVNVPSDARFIVRYHDQLDDSDHLVLLKKLPMFWCDGVPVYQLKDYVWDLNEDNKYTVEGPYGTIGSAYDWGISTLGVGYVAGFKVKGDTLKFEEIYSRPFVMEDTVTHIGCKIAYLSKGTYDSTNYDVSDSPSKYADNVDPSDMGVYEEEQPKDEQPTLTHGYLVCHKVLDEKRYTLMWELPISWTSLDSFYYYEKDVIERVVPGCKYNFVQLNMSAYAYGEAYMQPGDAASCAIVGNRIDNFTMLDRYSVRTPIYTNYSPEELQRVTTDPVCSYGTTSDADSKESFEDGSESVGQPISGNVNHPSHYTSHPSGIECIDITKHHDFCIGNAIKYLWRQGLKQDADKSVKEKRIEDLKKAAWYINAEIALIEKDRQDSEL